MKVLQRITLAAGAAGLIVALCTGCGGDALDGERSDHRDTGDYHSVRVSAHLDSGAVGHRHLSAGMWATAPNPSTTQPKDFPGSTTKAGAPSAPVNAKAQRYLAALKRQKVTIMGDTDNTIALTMAQFVCDQRGKNGDPTSMKAFVVAAVGPGEKTVEAANTKADKVIRAAQENYC